MRVSQDGSLGSSGWVGCGCRAMYWLGLVPGRFTRCKCSVPASSNSAKKARARFSPMPAALPRSIRLAFRMRAGLRNGATITSHFLGADRVIPIGQRRVSAEVNLAHLRVFYIITIC